MTDAYRGRLYEAYSTHHSGVADDAAAGLSFRRDIEPHLPADRSARVVDLGCGQGRLVRELQRSGYPNASGIDVSREQVDLAHREGITSVEHGDFLTVFTGRRYDVVTATDFFEHLTKSEVLAAIDTVHDALAPGGRLIMRVPNAVSPFSGHYQYGDFTHETLFTSRSLQQLGATVGFDRVEVHACPPVVHGWKSAGRLAVWKVVSGAFKLALAAETGARSGHLVTQNVVAVMVKAR